MLGDECRFADAAGFAAHEDPLSAARFVSPSPFQIFVDRFTIRIHPVEFPDIVCRATRIANDLRKPTEMLLAKIECENMSEIAVFVNIPTLHRQPWEARS